jgi:hypothetical protein
MALAEDDARERWRYYEQLAGVTRVAPHLPLRPIDPTEPSEEETP